MKTPLNYYGGKAMLSESICDLIDHQAGSHECYVELFAGGASVFFHKRTFPKVEVLNDTNRFLQDFYTGVRDCPDELYAMLDGGLYGAASDRDELLRLMEGIKGKFVFSEFYNDLYIELARKNGWNIWYKTMRKSASVHSTKSDKCEMLIWNFDAPPPAGGTREYNKTDDGGLFDQ